MSTIEDLGTRNRSSLLSLPPEVRCQIYPSLFRNQSLLGTRQTRPVSGAVGVPELVNDEAFSPVRAPSLLSAILFTCREIYVEAHPYFYTLIRFCLREGQLLHPLSPSRSEIQSAFGQNAQLVRHILHDCDSPELLGYISGLFPNLDVLEIDLRTGFYPRDHIHFESAIRSFIRYDGSTTIESALTERFAPGMVDALQALQRQGRSRGPSEHQPGAEERIPRVIDPGTVAVNDREAKEAERGFKVKLVWRLEYRFISFHGLCDLDEWILRIWNPDSGEDGASTAINNKTISLPNCKVYEVPQQLLGLDD